MVHLTTETPEQRNGHPGSERSDAFETFSRALTLYRKSKERVTELEKAVCALSVAPIFDPDYGMGTSFFISVRHPENKVAVDISTSPEFLRPAVEAALAKERAEFERMDRKLNAARKVLQSDL